MYVDVLLGLQWGDEGKGKIVDYLAPQYDVIARFQGGPNAGHTLVFNKKQHILHTIPSGIFREDKMNIIGNGVVVDPTVIKQEIEEIKEEGVDVRKNLYISKRAHLILPTHKALDAASEFRKGKSKIGSTLRGIGPAYMDKTGRNGLMIGDILSKGFDQRYQTLKAKHQELLQLYQFDFDIEEIEQQWFEGIDLLRSLNLVNSEMVINDQLAHNKKVLAEGAQGSMLDIDFGTYPYVTSSNTISSGACKGLGIPPTKVNEVIGVSKAYCTRVGAGPFPTELKDEKGDALRQAGNEYGATTGRPRRCGWLDIPALKYANQLNGTTQLAITKIDVLNQLEEIEVGTHYKLDGQEIDYFPFDLANSDIEPVCQSFPGWQTDLAGCRSFDDLNPALRDYLTFLEDKLGVAVSMLSNGPGREQLITKELSAKPA